MTIRLLYITKDPLRALIAERAGVDWIFVDLEYQGKLYRQAGRNTVISSHTVEDVIVMRKVLNRSQLMVRINPIGDWSSSEVDAVISAGCDIIMLPFFKTAIEVKRFISLVSGRAKTCLLFETMDSINAVEEILSIPGIDYTHVGLNDLHIERKTIFMFEFLADGSLDFLAEKFRKKEIKFGFGGIARIGELLPPAERILAEHYRLGSSGVILSRSFCSSSASKTKEEFEYSFIEGVSAIRKTEEDLKNKGTEFFNNNRIEFISEVSQVVRTIKNNQ